MKSSLSEKVYLTIAVIVLWFAIGLQFNLSLNTLNGDVWATLKIMLSFFTVLSNILCAIALTVILLFKNSSVGQFFEKSSTKAAITVYIVIVGIIYNLALRGLVVPSGWHSVANELLHVINPLLVLVYWIFFANKSNLEYKNAFTWLLYPLLYIIMIIVRGIMINKYPYPFINVVELGYPKALLNTLIILIVFYLVSVLFIFAGKRQSKA
ncbi:Pr6Pr family membrane protein [Pedobacter aquatilis]|uniref:Pr6Pr family membrane protein n=1 Tax=Pedobacter aquatilis TaxID=351343 RepID=UPI00292D5351|nr:Pr6Pr family membrane protein [Pedobacter aquatilis]